MSEISLYELEIERADLLPARETLQTVLFASPLTNTATNAAAVISTGNLNVAGPDGNAGNVLAAADSLQANLVGG